MEVNDALQLIQCIDAAPARLKRWEKELLQIARDISLRGYKLTWKQANKLSEVYARCYGGGNRQNRQYI